MKKDNEDTKKKFSSKKTIKKKVVKKKTDSKLVTKKESVKDVVSIEKIKNDLSISLPVNNQSNTVYENLASIKTRQFDFSVEQQALLKQRALYLAQKDSEDKDHSLNHPFVCCLLGEREKYGIEQTHVDEILYLSEITPVPCTPGFIAGVVNRRSQILPVLDIRQFFSIEKTELNEEARIVVLKNNTMLTGIIVNAIIDTDSFSSTELEPALPSEGLTNKEYVKGIYHGDTTILDINILLNDENILVNNKLQTA